jgi:hypothetical protein
MDKKRSMTGRIVPLNSPEASDSRMESTPDERVAAVAELTAIAWRLSGRALPDYTRSTMPVTISTLKEHAQEP